MCRGGKCFLAVCQGVKKGFSIINVHFLSFFNVGWSKREKIEKGKGTRENPKWHFWLQRCHFGQGPQKGALLSVIPKAVLCSKHYFIVFSTKHSFADMKECNLKKNRNLPRIRGCLPKCKKVFFLVCFFLVVLLFSSVFLCLCFVKRPKKVIFLQF